MMIIMRPGALKDQVEAVISAVEKNRLIAHPIFGLEQTIIGAVGDGHYVAKEIFEAFPGVLEVQRISKPYKLASRQFHEQDSVFPLDGFSVGGEGIAVIAGPCSVETQEQMEIVAAAVRKAGAKVLRAGAFKPRSSPYSFQGLGEPGLKILHDVAQREDLLTVSEVMEVAQLPLLVEYVDILQVGARNMQNFNLLRELGRIRKPVLLKRGLAATIEELLMAAEYIMAGGNYEVILCERGIRTFENATRNTLDISAIPVVQKLSHLPIIADPSHGTGRRDKVAPMARAAIAAGADGLIIEVHHDPDHALSDGAQSLFPTQFATLMEELRLIAQVIGKKL